MMDEALDLGDMLIIRAETFKADPPLASRPRSTLKSPSACLLLTGKLREP
jgi:hypothetical protein